MNNFFERISNVFSPEVKRISSIVLIILFVFQVLILLSPLDNIPRIELWDETVSLERGVNWSFDMLYSYENSPLYSFFYFLLSLFVEDTVTIYYLNHILLLIGLIFLSFLVLFRISGSLFWSILSSNAFIFFGFYKIWPRVNFLTSIVILMSMLLIFRIRNKLIKVNTALILSYVLIFIRPEFYITFYLLLIYSIYLIIKGLIRTRVEKNTGIRAFFLTNRTGLLLLTVVVLLLLLFVTPVPNGSNRSFHAFGQHYSVHVHKTEGLNSDPWIDWERIVKRDFGNSKSISEAIFYNSGAFLSHIGRNIHELWRLIVSVCRKGGWYTIGFCFFLLLLFVRYLIRKRSVIGYELPTGDPPGDIVIIFFYSVPVIFSLILIYPRIHYFLILWILLIILLTKLLIRIDFFKNIMIDRFFAFVLIILLFIPASGIGPNNVDGNLEIIRSIRKFESSRKLGSVLELGGRWSTYLKTVEKRYSRILDASDSWYKKNIDTIIVTNRLKKNIRGKLLVNIVENPGNYGFRIVKLKGGTYLLVNKKND